MGSIPYADTQTVPWSFVEHWREEIERNHSQTLEELNSRGGLDIGEIWAAANEKPLWEIMDWETKPIKDEIKRWFHVQLKGLEMRKCEYCKSKYRSERKDFCDHCYGCHNRCERCKAKWGSDA